MPTSSFDKEIIIEDIDRFIDALERSANAERVEVKVRYRELEGKELRRYFNPTFWDRIIIRLRGLIGR